MNINATLLGQAIAFLLFVWFCMKFVWPPIIDAIEERQKKISSGLENANRANKDLEIAKKNISTQLKEAKTQASKIIESAEKLRDKIVDDAKGEAITERDRIIALGHVEIEAERNRVKEDLRKQVSILAIACAEKLIEKNISADDEANAKIIKKFVAEL